MTAPRPHSHRYPGTLTPDSRIVYFTRASESQTIVLRPVLSRKPEWGFSLPTGPATTVRAEGQAKPSLWSPGDRKGEEIVVFMNKVNLAPFISTPERTQPSLESSVWVVAEMVTTEGDVPPRFFRGGSCLSGDGVLESGHLI